MQFFQGTDANVEGPNSMEFHPWLATDGNMDVEEDIVIFKDWEEFIMERGRKRKKNISSSK